MCNKRVTNDQDTDFLKFLALNNNTWQTGSQGMPQVVSAYAAQTGEPDFKSLAKQNSHSVMTVILAL